jgi:hypothetical protein
MSISLEDRLAAIEGKWKGVKAGDRLMVIVDPVDDMGIHILSWPLVTDERELEKLVDEVEKLRGMTIR